MNGQNFKISCGEESKFASCWFGFFSHSLYLELKQWVEGQTQQVPAALSCHFLNFLLSVIFFFSYKISNHILANNTFSRARPKLLFQNMYLSCSTPTFLSQMRDFIFYPRQQVGLCHQIYFFSKMRTIITLKIYIWVPKWRVRFYSWKFSTTWQRNNRGFY